jgi:hypothetical protein
VQQQIGVLFIIMQQVQPHSIIFIIASQQALIMSQTIASPLVHVIIMPSFVISHLHMPMLMLQVIMHMPFIIMQQLIMPPDIIVHRFCIIAQAVASGHMHIIFMPLSIFSMDIVQRGTIIMFMAGAFIIGAPIPMPIPPIGIPIPIMFPSIIVFIGVFSISPPSFPDEICPVAY